MEPLHVPGSKSVTHRAMVLAGASADPCTVTGALRSADTDATLACVARIGAQVEVDGVTLHFQGFEPTVPDGPLDCQNAGTGLRLLTAQAALRDVPITLTGDASLRSRPNALLLDALRRLGVHIEGGDQAPYTVQGPLQAGDVTLEGRTSSQFTSALLLALPQVAGASTVTVTPPVGSSPYLDLSLDVAHAFGLTIDEAPAPGRRFQVAGGQTPQADAFQVEADWSTAAFPLVAGALLGEARVAGLAPDSRQGDRRILSLLSDFGAHVQVGDTITVTRGELVSPGAIDVAATPDLFPILTILAAASQGTTIFTGGAALRHKESDRIQAMADGLQQLGVRVQERPDGLVVHGGPMGGGTVVSHGDHRVHMAFAIADRIATGTVHVDRPECVAVSYPQFHDHLKLLESS